MIERYTLPQMRDLWADSHRFERWLEVELAITDAWVPLGVVPADAAARIRQNAQFTVDDIKEIEGVTRHDVAAFVGCVQDSLGDDGRWLHFGVTSSDILDTALALVLVEAADIILGDLTRLLETLEGLARKHAMTVTVGRTHGVHAEPTTLGLKFLVWYKELQRQEQRILFAREDVRVGKISGAVGTFATVDPKVEEEACRILRLLPAAISTQILQRDRHAAYVCALANLGGTLEKIALEFRHLQRTEVLEAEEGFTDGQKGSSAMPHKRNPVNFEQITGLSRLLRSYAVAALEDEALWHERDISHSSVERVILPDATTLADYMLTRTNDLLGSVVIHSDRMKHNLERTRGLIYSQRVLLALIEMGMSRQDAYSAVQEAARKSWDFGRPFRDTLLEEPNVKERLSEGVLDALMNVEYYLRYVPDIFARSGVPLELPTASR